MNRLLAGTLPVVALYILQRWWVPFEDVQLWVAVATLPFAVVFIVAYIPERPWREWFGTSLLLLAVGVLFYTLSVILFRLYGPGYWGRDVMVIGSVGLVFTSMAIRAVVLVKMPYANYRGLLRATYLRYRSRIT